MPEPQAGLRGTRSRANVSVLGAALVLTVAGGAQAADPKLQVVGESSVGVTDNAQSAPDVPLPGGASKSPGAFVVLRPGLVLSLLSPRNVQRLAYTFDYDLYFARNATNSASNRLDYRGFFDLGPGVNAVVGAAASESDSYASLTFAPPATGALPFVPGATTKLFQGSADELVSNDFSVGWRGWEGAGIVYATPFSGTAPETLTPNGRLGGEYSWLGNALGAEVRADYAVVHNAVLTDGTTVPLERELVSRAVAIWRHDIGRYFSSRLEAGGARLDRLETHKTFYYPTGTATLGYADTFGDATLTYAHAVTTNVLLGQSYLADDIRLRGGIPLDQKATFSIAASVGYVTGRLLDQNAELATHLALFLGDVTFGWQTTPWLLLGIRAQHIDQRSDIRVPTLPVSFVQNNVMLGVAVKLPPDAEMPAAYRSPQRVDRTDELRTATVPDGQAVAAPTGRSR
jgi:hypothetical protein